MVDISYSPQIQPDALPGRAAPRLPDEVNSGAFGGQVGRAIEGAGEVAQQHYDAVMSQARQTQLTDAHNQLQGVMASLTRDPDTGAFTKEGKNAFGLNAQYLPQYDDAAEKIVGNVADPRARQAAQLASMQIRNQLSEQLDNHEIEQHRQFSVKTAQDSVKIAADTAAANYNHPDIIANNIDTTDVSLQNLAQQQGWSDDQLKEATHQAHVQLHAGVLTNMLSDNKVDLAKAYLDGVRGELKPEEIKTATKAIEAGQVKATSDSIMSAYAADTTQGAKQVTDLDKSGLSQEQQFAVIQEVERQRNDLQMQRRQDPKIQQQMTNLQDSLAKGTPGPNALGDVDTLWHRGAVSDDQRQALRNRIEGIQGDTNNDAERMSWITDHYHNSVPIDPKSTDNQKLVGQMFTQMTQGVDPASPEYANYAADIAKRVGVIPEPAVSWARAHLVGGDPKSAAQAADLMSRVIEASPRDVSYAIDEKERALSSGISSAVNAGADPEAAVEVARKNSEMGDTQTKVLDEQWKKVLQKNPQAQSSDLAARLGKDDRFKPGMFSSVPTIPSAMQTQYDTLTQDYFKYTGGDIQQARTLASSDLKRVWGVSEVNGKRELMPYAPEAMYPGLTPDVIRSDISSAVPGRTNVRLTLDPQRTARSQGAEWNLTAPDDNGLLEVMRDPKGNPLVYRLPITKEDYAAAREPAAQAGLEKARQIRAERQARDDLQGESGEMLGTGSPEPH